MTDDPALPQITMISGQTLLLRAARLYPIEQVQALNTIQAKAAKLLGGVSTGIGFWGSPTWALGGAAALGVLEGILSAAARKQAADLIREANQKRAYMLGAGSMVAPASMSGIHLPDPTQWTGVVDGCPHVYDGSEFLIAETDCGLRHIKWSAVSLYWGPEHAAEDRPSARLLKYKDRWLPPGSEIYDSLGVLIAVLPNGTVFSNRSGAIEEFDSAARYRALSGDSREWRLIDKSETADDEMSRLRRGGDWLGPTK